jgi:hypothetical protein
MGYDVSDPSTAISDLFMLIARTSLRKRNETGTKAGQDYESLQRQCCRRISIGVYGKCALLRDCLFREPIPVDPGFSAVSDRRSQRGTRKMSEGGAAVGI